MDFQNKEFYIIFDELIDWKNENKLNIRIGKSVENIAEKQLFVKACELESISGENIFQTI